MTNPVTKTAEFLREIDQINDSSRPFKLPKGSFKTVEEALQVLEYLDYAIYEHRERGRLIGIENPLEDIGDIVAADVRHLRVTPKPEMVCSEIISNIAIEDYMYLMLLEDTYVEIFLKQLEQKYPIKIRDPAQQNTIDISTAALLLWILMKYKRNTPDLKSEDLAWKLLSLVLKELNIKMV